MKKQVKVVMLPTKKVTNIGKYQDTGNLVYNNGNDIPRGIFQHLYFLSDDEIKEGDWYFDGVDFVHKKSKYNDALVDGNKKAKKIIATTDEELGYGDEFGAFYQLPRPSNEFLKKYCELGGVDKVLVEYELCNNVGYLDSEKLKVASDNTITIK